MGDRSRSAPDHEVVESENISEIEALKAELRALEAENSALQEQGRQYKLFAENVRDTIWTMDLNLRYTYVSPSNVALTGMNPEEALNISMANSLSPRSAELASREIEEAFAREARGEPQPEPPEPLELELIRQDGEKVDIEVVSTFLRDADGKPTGILGVSRNITEQKRARADSARWAQVFESAHWGIAMVDRDTGNFTLVNKAYSAMHGYAEGELIGKLNSVVYPEGHMEHRQTQLRRAFKQGHHSWESEHVQKDGTTFPVRVDATAIKNDEGEVAFWAVNVVDLTVQKRGEKALRMASRMEATATLAGGIAHDFNNLMVGVMGNASLVKMKLGEGHFCEAMLNEVSDAAEEAGGLSQQLVAYARGGKYQPKTINLNDSLESVLELQLRTFPPRIEIAKNLDAALLNVDADPTQMSQVIMNLCLNAVEAIGEMGVITIESENVLIEEKDLKDRQGLHTGRFAKLTISDTGQGMSDETRAKAFEPFFSTKAQGRGLGLAAAYGIVKNHGGAIYASSSESCGTSISIFIPANDKRLKEKVTSDKEIAAGSETVLVIDDEPLVLTVTQQLLEHFGYEVVCAKNGKEAVEIASTYQGDIRVALLDMGMPVMGGAEAFPLLMKVRPAMKVIICSGYELAGASQNLLDSGASAFVQKPFLPHDLCSEIRKAIDNN